MKYLLIASLLATAATVYAGPDTYTIDTSHSSIKFSIRHFVAKTTGVFKDFEGTIVFDKDNLGASSIEAIIQIPSIDTASEKRDAHLQEDDYFDSGAFPFMTFNSTAWTPGDSENFYVVTGDLKMRGKTLPVTLEVELLGIGEGRKGAILSGWEANGTLDRTLWGVSGGQGPVGNEVDITINIEAVLQK